MLLTRRAAKREKKMVVIENLSIGLKGAEYREGSEVTLEAGSLSAKCSNPITWANSSTMATSSVLLILRRDCNSFHSLTTK